VAARASLAPEGAEPRGARPLNADADRARVDALFAAALDLPAAERTAFLAEACAAEAGLRAEVEELLRLAAAPGHGPGAAALLAGGPRWRAHTIDLETDVATSVGVRVGPWRLDRELGRGGMGTVYLAARVDGGFEQRAALKLLQAGLDTADVIRRFERERQILARLEHPNVARLLDGGCAPDGRPYFAMEYVEGRPIDRYCDEKRLSVEDRLGLVVAVGRAVQYAHQHLVVHRDLKPSNVMVSDQGEVKLLDFGIAKVLEAEGQEGEPLTRKIDRILTPEYASPEQVLGHPVSVASDVYQLGLLLYELLTGEAAQRVAEPTPDSLERVVCEGHPTRPSAVVTTSVTGREAAAARRTTPSGLARMLRGDLDNIVLRALRKEPARRYASAEQLVDDIERFRRRLPVRARPDTLGYRARKLMRRHPLAVGAAITLALVSVGYTATITYHSHQLARERDRARLEALKAERVRDFLVGLFEAADPYRTKGEMVTAAELLQAGARRAHEELGHEPEVQAAMLEVVGTVLRERASYDSAEPLLAEALRLERQLHSGDHADLAGALHGYAAVLIEKGQLARGEELAREGLSIQRRLFPAVSEEVATSLASVADVVLRQGRYAEAESLYREALGIRLGVAGSQEAELAGLWNNLGVALDRQAKHAEAEATHRRALAVRRRLYEVDHPAVSESLNSLAVTLRRQGKLEEPERLYREALDIRLRVFGLEHPQVANVLNNLAEVQRRMGKFAEAEANHREALRIRRAVFGPRHSNLALSLHNVGCTLRDAGRTREAESLLREALALFRETLPAGHAHIAASAMALGRILVAAGRADQGEPLLVEALAIRSGPPGGTSMAAEEGRLALGLCRAAQGRTAEARQLLAAGVEKLGGAMDADPTLLAEARAALARLPSREARSR
jgi:eukaryotic-like serine/threonine-protein kinase